MRVVLILRETGTVCPCRWFSMDGIYILKEYLYALVLLVFLRTNGGGLHFKHYLSCFAMSFCVLLGSVMLGIYIPMLHMIALVIIGISIFIGYKYVPVMSANRPPASVYSDRVNPSARTNCTTFTKKQNRFHGRCASPISFILQIFLFQSVN